MEKKGPVQQQYSTGGKGHNDILQRHEHARSMARKK